MSDLNLAIKLTTEGGKIVVKDLQQLEQATGKVNHSLKNTGKSGAVAHQGLTKASGGADALTGSLKSMAMQAAGVVALGLGINNVASGMYDSIDAFQGYRGQLKTITGDFDSASVELDRLIQLSKETPFTLAQSVEGFSKLTHLGLEPSKKAMISYGNTAAAMGKDLMQMIEAVADASTGEFERLKEFGIKASSEGDKVRFTFQNVSTTIKKDAQSIQQYLLDIGTKKFGGAMGDQMGRLSAKASNLQTSIAQLYDQLGQAGAANVFGSSLDGAAMAIDGLTAHLPKVVALLSTFTEIVMVGGGAYLGLKVMPFLMLAASTASKALAVNILATSMAYKAGVSPVALFTGGIKASTVATKQAIVSAGLLKTAAGLLFAAYAGWEFGSYLSEQFVAVRVAGLAFVGAMETGLVNMSYAFSAIAPKAKQVWGELTSYIQNKLGSLYGLIADGLESIGADDMAKGYRSFAKSLDGSSDAAKAATKALAALEAQRKADIAAVDKTIISLIQHEYAQETSTKAAIKNKKVKEEKVAAVSAELTANQKLIASLGQEIAITQMSAQQKRLHTIKSKLSKDATLGEIQAVELLTKALFDQQQLGLEKQADSDYYQSIIDGANDVGESWNTASNVIVNAFGSIGEQLDKLATQQESYANKQKQLAADKVKYADDPKKLAEIGRAENALAKQKNKNAMSEVSSYHAITDSAASMFSENSKGRKAMQAASDVFTAIELANSALRIGSYAIEAVTAAFAAPWPIGFASGAAMIAIMAGLGVAVSGGSGSAPTSSAQRQKTQGTGTVLGSDDKSNSLLNAYERIESLELDQYAELREMNNSLSDLNNNITHLATSLVSQFGRFDASSYSGDLSGSNFLDSGVGSFLRKVDPVAGIMDMMGLGGLADAIFGGFSSTKKTIVDSGISIVSQTMGEVIDTGLLAAQAYFDIKKKKKKFWGASSKTSYYTNYQAIDEQIQHEMALVFGNIGESALSAAKNLGFTATDIINTTLIDSLADFNAAGLNDASKDWWKNYKRFLAVKGQELVDITQLSLEDALAGFEINIPNLSLMDLDGEEMQAELQAVFSKQADLIATRLVPSIQDFQQVGEGLYDTLIRLTQEQTVFNSVLEITGNTMAKVSPDEIITATQAIIGYAGGISELQSAAGTFFSEFFSEGEQFTYLQKQLNAQFDSLGESLPKTRDGFKDLVSALDPLNEADQRLYASLLLLAEQSGEYYDAIEKQGDALEAAHEKQQAAIDETLKKEQALADARVEFAADIAAQLEQLDFTPLEQKLYNLQQQFDRYISEAKELGANTILLETLYSKKRETILEQALKEAYEKQLALINKKYQRELAIYDGMRTALDSLKEAADSLLLSDLSTLTNKQRFTESRSRYQTTLAAAKGGDVDAVSALDNVQREYLSEARSMYASSDAYQVIFDNVLAQANNVAARDISPPKKPPTPSDAPTVTSHNSSTFDEILIQLTAVKEELKAQELKASARAAAAERAAEQRKKQEEFRFKAQQRAEEARERRQERQSDEWYGFMRFSGSRHKF